MRLSYTRTVRVELYRAPISAVSPHLQWTDFYCVLTFPVTTRYSLLMSYFTFNDVVERGYGVWGMENFQITLRELGISV